MRALYKQTDSVCITDRHRGPGYIYIYISELRKTFQDHIVQG